MRLSVNYNGKYKGSSIAKEVNENNKRHIDPYLKQVEKSIYNGFTSFTSDSVYKMLRDLKDLLEIEVE